MTPYLAVLSFVALAAAVSLLSPLRNRWILVAPSTTVLLLFMGLRERVGGDWDMYLLYFRTYAAKPFLAARQEIPTEIGYGILNAIIGKATGNLHLLLLLCAAVMLYGILRVAREFDLDPSLTLFLSAPYLLFVAGMGYQRQSIAIGLAFVAVCEHKQKNAKLFYLYSVLATSFHYSAAPFLLVFWVNSWYKALLSILLFSMSVLLSQTNDVVEKINGYSTGSAVASGVWFRLSILAIGLVFAWIQRDSWRGDDEVSFYVKRSAAVFALMCIFASPESVIVDRLNLYFFFGYLLCLGKAVQFAKPGRRWLTFTALNVQAFGIFVVWFATSSYARYSWTPYNFSFY
jgi:hypothetical protein